MSNAATFFKFGVISALALTLATLVSAISDEYLDDYYTVGPWVMTDVEGDKDGFGLGLGAGDVRPVSEPWFDEREFEDPEFTDVMPVPFTDPSEQVFTYVHTFEPPQGPFDATLRILSLGIQDGDDQVEDSDTDIRLYLDGLEVPGAFDDVDQFDSVPDVGWAETVGYVELPIPTEVSHVLLDGYVELTYEVIQLGAHPGLDVFAIDFSELVMAPSAVVRVEILSDTVASFDLPDGLESALLATLNEVTHLLENDNPDDDVAAVNMLLAFLKKVDAKTGKTISQSLADYLTGQVLDILSELVGDERCPCWGLADLYALPIEGATAVCAGDYVSWHGISQEGICEHSYGVGIHPNFGSLHCTTQRFDCPGFFDLGTEAEIDESEFSLCLAQVVTRCEELGLDVPEFP